MEMELVSPPLESNKDALLGEKSETDQPTQNKEEKEWMKRLKKFSKDSSFSGVVDKFKSKSIFKRIFWACVIFAAVVAFCTVTALSIRTLIREPISTSITVLRKESLDFPAVTVCSLSILNTTRLDEFNNDLGLEDGFYKHNMLQMFRYAGGIPPDLANCQSIADNLVNISGYDEGYGKIVTEHARNDPRVLLRKCVFLGEDCLDSLTEINTISGVCIMFNGPSTQLVRTVSGTGPGQGLHLELNTGEQFFSLRSNHGFNVIIHNRDEIPRPETEGVVVGLDSVMYVGMREVVSTDKTMFHSGVQCTTQTHASESQLSVQNYTTYSPALCQSECFYKFLADRCQCVEESFYRLIASPYTEMPRCRFQDMCCETFHFERFNDLCNCMPKCETVERSLTVSSATSSESGKVNINVYYETLLVESRETIDAYSPWSLVSDIGGNTGLFLGFTVITAVELVMLVIGLITDCCCLSCKKQKQ